MSEGYSNTIVLRNLVAALQRLCEGSVDLVAGAREVVQWRFSNHGLDRECRDFLFLVEFDSEMDRFPTGEARERWNIDALVALDAERMEAEAFYRNDVSKSASNLLQMALEQLKDSRFREIVSDE